MLADTNVGLQNKKKQDGTASIERVLSFFLSGGKFRGGDNDHDAAGNGRTSNSTQSPGRSGGHRGRGYFLHGDDAGGGDETDEVLQDARDKLREGLGLGSTATADQKLSPRRLFNDLDPDGSGEVTWDSMDVLTGERVTCSREVLALSLIRTCSGYSLQQERLWTYVESSLSLLEKTLMIFARY